MPDTPPASRETDAKVASVLGYREVGSDYRGWWGTPPGSPLANLPDGLGSTLIPSFTTSAPDDWSVVGEMVGWLRSRCSDVRLGVGDNHLPYAAATPSDGSPHEIVAYGTSPGHAVGQVLLRIAEQEAKDE